MQINTVHDRCAEGLVADRLHSTPRAAVLRFPLGGSCGIPLIILSPVGIEILTWAFMGFDSQSAGDPSCVLVLGRTDGGPIAAEASLTVRARTSATFRCLACGWPMAWRSTVISRISGR